jgi:hypothetical protein
VSSPRARCSVTWPRRVNWVWSGRPRRSPSEPRPRGFPGIRRGRRSGAHGGARCRARVMPVLSLDGVTLELGGQRLLDGVNLHLEPGRARRVARSQRVPASPRCCACSRACSPPMRAACCDGPACASPDCRRTCPTTSPGCAHLAAARVRCAHA